VFQRTEVWKLNVEGPKADEDVIVSGSLRSLDLKSWFGYSHVVVDDDESISEFASNTLRKS